MEVCCSPESYLERAVMSADPSVSFLNSQDHSAANPIPEDHFSSKHPELPPGTWVTEAVERSFPDRCIPRRIETFGPLNPENDGWIWPERMRAGDVVVVVGEGASGKSTLMADWIARVTTGTPFPDCEPGEALPPSDVLLFQAGEDFARKVIPRIEAAGGDVDRVIRASRDLLKQKPEQGITPVRLGWGNRLGPRVHLGEPALVAALYDYLFDRPTIRMVVIDQANVHLRCASERQFESVIHALAGVAQMCEVALVITMQPDAFRRAEGVSKYLQSRSLKQNAHSVWRITPPTDPEVPGRVLECLKISSGVADSGRQNWHLVQNRDQRLEWNRADGTELAPGKELLKHRNLLRVREFLDQALFVLGGIAEWDVLAERGANHGIQPVLLREAILYWNLGTLFEPQEGNLRESIGWAEQIAARKEQLRAQQALDREAYRAGRTPVSVDPPPGEPAVTDATPGEPQPGLEATTNVPAKTSDILSGGASFMKPEVVAGGEGGRDQEREVGASSWTGGKTPPTGDRRVTQAG
jgi:hypothetical protein